MFRKEGALRLLSTIYLSSACFDRWENSSPNSAVVKTIDIKHLWLEVTNRCNSNCVFCGRQWALPPKDMDFDLFKKIVDQCPTAKIVQTQGFGEPLLYPHIVDAVRYATQKGKKVVFYTNGSLLTEKMSRALLKAGLWRIIFSVENMDKESYEATRRGLSWDTLIENVTRFQHLRNLHHYKTLTTVRMCETKENRNQIQNIRGFWGSRVDVVTSRAEVDIPAPTELRESPYVISRPISCNFPYNYLCVKSNGDVVMCCRDWFHVYVVANLHETTVKEAYEGENFDKIRKSHKTGIELPYLCHICKSERTPGRYLDEELPPP